MDSENLDDILNYDALAEAGKLTGKSYNKINEERISLLPDFVQEVIKGKR